MLSKIFLVLTAVVEVYCYNMLLGTFFKPKYVRKKHYIFLGVVCFLHMINSYLNLNYIQLALILILFFVLSFAYDCKIYLKFVFTAIFAVDTVVCELVVGALSMLLQNTNYYNSDDQGVEWIILESPQSSCCISLYLSQNLYIKKEKVSNIMTVRVSLFCS